MMHITKRMAMAAALCLAAGTATAAERKHDLQTRMVHRWLNGYPVVATPDTHEGAGRMVGLPREKWGQSCMGLAYRFINTGGSPLLMDKLPCVESEHQAWAKPYGRGSLKVLYVNNTYGIGEAAMLEQRGDLDVYIFNVPAHFGWEPWHKHPEYGAFLERRMRELLAYEPDVIVLQTEMSDRGPDLTLPAAVHAMILEKARAGAGLVFVPRYNTACKPEGRDVFSQASPLRYTGQYLAAPETWEKADFQGSHPIVQGVPLPLLYGGGGYILRSTNNADAVVAVTLNGWPYLATGRCGKGRTVAFGYSSDRLVPERGSGYVAGVDRELREEAYRWHEYAYSLILKAILWAGNKEPRVSIEAPAVLALRQAEPTNLCFRVAQAAGEPRPLALHATLRGDEYEIEQQETFTFTLEPGETRELAFTPAGPLREGLHLLDVALRDTAGKVENWGSLLIVVSSPLTLRVETDQPTYAAGDTVEALTTVESGNDLTGLTIHTELWDSYGRLMAVQESPLPDTRQVRTRFPLRDVVGRVFDVRSSVRRDGACLIRHTREITVPVYDWGDEWVNKLWATAERDMAPLYRAVGTTALTCGAYAHRLGGVRRNARAGFDTYFRSVEPHPGSSYATGPDDDRHRILALDPERIEKERRNVVEASETIRRYGALGFILSGEKVIYYDSSYDPFSLTAFNTFVREKYKTLDALNAQWGTGYATWEDVGPIKTEAWRAKHTDNFSQWLEFRRFMDRTYTAADADTAQWWAESLGRPAPVGHDQSFGLYQHTIPYGCHDYYGMFARGLDAWISYRGGDSGMFAYSLDNYNDSIQGFEWLAVTSWCKGPVMGLGGWLGGGIEGWVNYEGRSWSVLFNGGRGMDWYEPSMFFAGYGALQPNGARIWESTREIGAGIGKALIGAARRTDPVAVWQDMSNEYAAWLLKLPAAGFSRWDMVMAFYNNGIKPALVSGEQIEAGGLSGYRLLYMPSIACVSEPAAARIREFVANGGVVVADILAGAYDGLGKPLAKGNLDDVFGIERASMSLVRERARAVYTERHPALPLAVDTLALGFNIHWYDDMPAGTWEGDVKPKGVRTCGKIVPHGGVRQEAPAFLINPVGKGYALFLNFLPTPYVYGGQGDVAVYDLARAILSMAGVKPEVELTAGGQPVRFFDRNRFKRREAWYVGLLRYPDKSEDPETVQIGLPARGHVYEMRSGRYFGETRTIADRFRPRDFNDAVRVYAVLPYRVDGLTLKAPSAVARGKTLEYTARVGGAKGTADHVMRVEVSDAGASRPWYHQKNVLAVGGVYRGTVPIALNDGPGTWRLTITDVISGKAAQETFTVQ